MSKMVTIKGIQKTSLIDYPEKICTILFTPGCNFKCGFCYNGSLVTDHVNFPSIPHDEIIEFLKSRTKWIDGVCITGGEPLMFDDIEDLLKKIKSIGLLVKLDTNGTYPLLLKELISKGLVDYVAMDIKNSLEKYDDTAETSVDKHKILQSIKLIKDSGIYYEFRTTVLRKFHTIEDFKKIANLVKGAKKYYIQNYKHTPEVIDKSLSSEESFSLKEIEEFKNILEKTVEFVGLRNV